MVYLLFIRLHHSELLMQAGATQRRALRYAIYIRLLGDEPLSFEHSDYGAYELELHAQFALLCLKAGAHAARSARKRGEDLIRRKGVFATAAELSNPSATALVSARDSATEERSDGRHSPTRTEKCNCRRKVRHARFWSALSHAAQLHDPNLCVYTCAVCNGLHVGHNRAERRPKAEETVRNQLDAINQAIRQLDRGRIHLRREKRTLLKRYGYLTLIPRISNVLIQLFCRVLSLLPPS
jgi:hypothetical protein